MDILSFSSPFYPQIYILIEVQNELGMYIMRYGRKVVITLKERENRHKLRFSFILYVFLEKIVYFV